MINLALLIDDDKASNFISTKYLTDSKLVKSIVSFEKGQLALNYLSTIELFPDIIFLDINMPTMDGWEFLEKYRNLNLLKREKTRIVLLSTAISSRDNKRRLDYPEIDKIILKPLNTDIIKQLINNLSSIS